ncbi:hypothetical protein AJ79_04718 [Helicocarpus griseus UAMH5409]|uniref:C-CAP/cofactor C-like domain-containing protein n=1 Tax=Helicocarpus griseus UAMH5409 TaxID=1447875 RepID=A0A2B7XRW7_9EURO|nr:hypothetical protein AJ79_04718 [Helicocarpus griseus UAMH5409]
MSSPAPSNAHQTESEGYVQSKTEISLKDRFFRYFQHEITALQEQMDRLGHTALIGGERADAIDHCLAGIARLSSEVKDASASIPPYDQRIYADAIKALQDKLAEVRASFAPRSKFSFKTARKNPSALSLSEAAEIAAQGRRHIPDYRSNDNSMQSPGGLTKPETNGLNNSAMPPSSAGDSSVSLSSHTGVHIVLPISASHATVPASVTSLHHCVVDMSIPTADGRPFAGLVINGVTESLLLCGQVNGAAHITGVKNSVIVVACHQFRMHDCTDVDVYLCCSSKPIIEDCSGIRFGKIPEIYAPEHVKTGKQPNLWDQAQDFKWIKAEQSPNWKLIDDSERVSDDMWVNILPGGPGMSLDAILKAVKVVGA